MRVYTDGAEMGDLMFWSSTNNGSCGTTTPSPHSGDYYYECSGSYPRGLLLKSNPTLSECYFRFRIYFPDRPGDSIVYIRFASAGTELASIEPDAANRLYLSVHNTKVGTSLIAIQKETWYLLEVYYKIDDAPNGRFDLKLDGNTIITYTGDTKYSTYSTFDNIYFEASHIIVDDLALNDTTGGVDDSWCGDGIITKITPLDNGAHNNWHGSDANDVDNFELVDEYPNDGDTTYVYHDSTASGTQDQYDMTEDYDGTDKTIIRIYAECRARVTGSTADTLKIGILPSGWTDEVSAGETLTTGAYTRIVGTEYLVNPADSGTWEEADIDALEGVIEVG
jgi:hypothetical protein